MLRNLMSLKNYILTFLPRVLVGSRLCVSLTFIFFVAFFVRVMEARSGLPYIYFWDEPQIAGTALNMLRTGDFNPHFFNYGSLMIYLNYLVNIFHFFQIVGLPERNINHIVYLSDIITNHNSQWYWTVSHPSFYFANRVLNCFFGAGTAIVTALITSEVLGKFWITLFSAFIISFLPFHVHLSAVVTPDVPAAFFVCSTILFSIKFVKTSKTSFIVVSLIFCGFATATKYNSALVGIVPVIAAIFLSMQGKIQDLLKLISIIIFIPSFVFVISMPYSLLDPVNFISGVGYEIRHYKVDGHPGATSEPGIPHLIFQLNEFLQNFGIIYCVFGLIGFIVFYRYPGAYTCFIYFIMFMLYMSQMRVNFHRNFVQIYPLFALSICIGIDFVLNTVKKTKGLLKIRYLVPSVIVLLTATIGLACLNIMAITINHGLMTLRARDTRSTLPEELNMIEEGNKIIIATELRMHRHDLVRLNKIHTVTPITDIIACQNECAGSILVLPSNAVGNNSNIINNFVRNLDSTSIIKRIEGNNLSLEGLSNSPGILIARIIN